MKKLVCVVLSVGFVLLAGAADAEAAWRGRCRPRVCQPYYASPYQRCPMSCGTRIYCYPCQPYVCERCVEQSYQQTKATDVRTLNRQLIDLREEVDDLKIRVGELEGKRSQ